MRGLTAFLLGIVATVGYAYWHDRALDDPSKKLVNWEVAGEVTRTAATRAKEEWNRLTAN
jgi:hypothetical protein